MNFLPINLTEKNFFRSCQTHVYLVGIGYCPINYWVEKEIEQDLVAKSQNSSKSRVFKRLGLLSIGIVLGVMFVNLRVG